MSSTQEEFKKNYLLIVKRIFNNWQNLRLAVEHGMGGRNGQQVAIQIMEYVYQYCIGNENITRGELQVVMEELMDQEFNTLCDDCSISEICSNLLRYKELSLQGLYTQIEYELSKLPQGKEWLNSDVKITYTPISGDSSSDDEDLTDGDENEMEVEMDENKDEASCSQRVTRSQTQKNMKDDFVEPEVGWTTVRSRRK